MVDVAAKAETARTATARGRIVMAPETLALIREGRAGKGDVLGVARLAGIMAAKRTSDLIPLCHPLMLSKVAVDLEAEVAAGLVMRAGAGIPACPSANKSRLGGRSRKRRSE